MIRQAIAALLAAASWAPAVQAQEGGQDGQQEGRRMERPDRGDRQGGRPERQQQQQPQPPAYQPPAAAPQVQPQVQVQGDAGDRRQRWQGQQRSDGRMQGQFRGDGRPADGQRGFDQQRFDQARQDQAQRDQAQQDRGRGEFQGRGSVDGDGRARGDRRFDGRTFDRGVGLRNGDGRNGDGRYGDGNRFRTDNGRGYDARGGRTDWNRSWRGDGRYDWNRYRQSNRSAFRLPRYYAPANWGYGYRRFQIGVTLSSLLWGQDYWIDEPAYYRLPPAYGPYRWVRYYNDALLVDIRSGYVVDTVYDIFW